MISSRNLPIVHKTRLVALIGLLLTPAILLAQLATPRLENPVAAEHFRLGILSYYKGQYSDAILSLEKGITLVPESRFLLDWLGRAYYKSGLETIAIERWERSLALGGPSPSLQSRIELLKHRRSVIEGDAFSARFIETQRTQGLSEKSRFFSRPSCILPLADGSHWVVSYGTNEIVRIDANGLVLQHVTAAPGGFDRPFGMVRDPSGKLYVTESNGNRVTILSEKGALIKRFGKTGRKADELLGPQGIILAADGYLFVVDYGNRGVKKFDTDGNPILAFGDKRGKFPGFMSPTGIVEIGDSIFVADSVRKAIFRFDRNGNHEATLQEGELRQVESLSKAPNGRILVCDRDEVYLLDPETESKTPLWGGSGARLVHAAFDVNDNVLCADFNGNRILTLSDPATVYAGYDISVERVNAKSFPSVDALVRVRTRNGKPVVGLKRENFYVSELTSKTEKREENKKTVLVRVDSIEPVGDLKISGDLNRDEAADCAIVVELSQRLAESGTQIRAVSSQILDFYKGRGSVSFITAGKLPELQDTVAETSLARTIRDAKYSPNWDVDAALRLAAQRLTPGLPKRTIYLLTSGQLPENGFSRFGISETGALLSNNAIRLVIIQFDRTMPNQAFTYLADVTGGRIIDAMNPAGIVPALREEIAVPTGFYTLSFSSKADSNFGKAYMPFAVEVYVASKSGREESGYYAPLR